MLLEISVFSELVFITLRVGFLADTIVDGMNTPGAISWFQMIWFPSCDILKTLKTSERAGIAKVSLVGPASSGISTALLLI